MLNYRYPRTNEDLENPTSLDLLLFNSNYIFREERNKKDVTLMVEVFDVTTGNTFSGKYTRVDRIRREFQYDPWLGLYTLFYWCFCFKFFLLLVWIAKKRQI